jgi:hypothetical protein
MGLARIGTEFGAKSVEPAAWPPHGRGQAEACQPAAAARPTQQRRGVPSGAPGLLLCQEAGVSPAPLVVVQPPGSGACLERVARSRCARAVSGRAHAPLAAPRHARQASARLTEGNVRFVQEPGRPRGYGAAMVLVFGHIGGVPVEELLPLAPVGATLVLAGRALVARAAAVVNSMVKRRGDAR